jgi:RIO-like serine/threonine protein kinase
VAERAEELLERDVGNVLAFFKRKYGVERDFLGITKRIV